MFKVLCQVRHNRPNLKSDPPTRVEIRRVMFDFLKSFFLTLAIWWLLF